MNALRRRLRRSTSVALAAFVFTLLPAAGAVAAPAVTDCAVPMTVAELQDKLTAAGDDEYGAQVPVPGDGLTVVTGTVARRFEASILGIDYNGIGIDHDLIIAELSGLGIDANRGVWAGMSGSPVYVDDKLIGAVAYGFTWGPSALAGITPAEEMLEMTSGTAVATSPDAMTLNVAQRMDVAAQTEQSVASVPGRVPRLQVPLGLNVGSDRLAWLQKQASADNARVTPVAGSGYSTAAAPEIPITPGSNFAAALSVGDITAAGTGTTTWTCGTESLAFGHPFFWEGKTSLALHGAKSMAIVTDPSFGSYKFATLGAPVGLVDQDRFTGIHGTTMTGPPATTPIESFTIAEHPDGSYESDHGVTNVTYGDYVPFITFLHGFSNIDFLLDRYYSDGSSEVTWTVDMTHAGKTYQLRRTNQFTSSYDISIDSMIEPWMQLEQLANSKFGPVTFDNVSLRAEAVDVQRRFRVRSIEVRRDGRWYKPTRRLLVKPGRTFPVRTTVQLLDGSSTVATRRLINWFTVPWGAAGAYGAVTAGNGGGGFGEEEFCFITGECGGSSSSSVDSFGDLVTKLARAPRNDQLRASMSLYGRRNHWTQRRQALLSKAVVGGASLPLRVADPEGTSGSGGGSAGSGH